MNTTQLPPTTRPAVPAAREALTPLRAVLAANALTSLAAGVAAAVAPAWAADRLGVDVDGWVRAVGVFLIVFAVDVALVARA
ncbi:MAG: hypothetical protein H0W25_15120, partial [Acidimicrobiia bacterium]|nr:hypothetical protein [Acidimicrobiia bacterium]